MENYYEELTDEQYASYYRMGWKDAERGWNSTDLYTGESKEAYRSGNADYRNGNPKAY
jgi:hypothetical protein